MTAVARRAERLTFVRPDADAIHLSLSVAAMRVLFASTAGEGHFAPMVPVAKACQAAGHEVLVAAPESFARTVSDAGLPHAQFADVPPEQLGAVMAQLPTMSFAEANRTVVRRVFCDLDARAALPGVRHTAAEFRPDLVVREPAELGSLLAATAAGVPNVQMATGVRFMDQVFLAELEEPLEALEADIGLDPGQCFEALLRAPSITSVPELIDDVDLARWDEALAGYADPAPTVGPIWRFREESSGPPGVLPPAWSDPALPLVYVSFGSVAGSLGPFGGIFPAALAALADQPCRVLLTTGRGFDRGTLPPLPDNAKVEPWWPQQDVLPHASVVVGHGGFGTTMGALTAGVPQVVVPVFTTDQLINAVHVAAAGAGVMLPEWSSVEDQLADAVATVSSDPQYRRSAEQIAKAIAALPDHAAAVPLLAELAAARR